MTSSKSAVTPLRQRMIEDMQARNLGRDSKRNHIGSCKRFAAWLGRCPRSTARHASNIVQKRKSGLSCRTCKPITQALFLVHGEEQARLALTKDLVERGFPSDRVISPVLDEEIDLLADPRQRAAHPIVQRLPADAFVEFDWHNDLADFSFELREAFEQAADEKSRAVLKRRSRRALKSDQ